MVSLGDIVSSGEIYQILHSTLLFDRGIDAFNSGGGGIDASGSFGRGIGASFSSG
jgi:hypothetical protein